MPVLAWFERPGRWALQQDPQDSAVSSLLESKTSLPADWIVHRVRQRRPTVIEVSLGPVEGILARLAVGLASDQEFKAFQRGPLYATAYEHIVDETSSEEKRGALAVAMRLCEEIAALSGGIDLAEEETGAGTDEICSRPELEATLAARLPVGEELVDGWRLRQVAAVEEGELHCVFEHEQVPILPKLVLHHGSGDGADHVVRMGWRVTYRTRFGLSAPARIGSYHEILSEALADVLGAVK